MNLAHSSPSTDGDLEALVERFFRERFSTDNPIITEAVKRMLCAGGKRLRPRVTLLAAAACGGKPVEPSSSGGVHGTHSRRDADSR